jgi:hypothetical protein
MASNPDPVQDVYASEYPSESTPVPQSLKDFIKHYYTSVDTRGNHEAYANCFAQDAHLVAHGHEWNGRDGKVGTI